MAVVRLLSVVAVALSLAVRVPAAAEEPTGAAVSLLAPHPTFVYQKSQIAFTNDVLEREETKDYIVRNLHFPSVAYNGQPGNIVTGKYYQSKHEGARPLIIVLPIWGRHTYPPEKMTDHIKNYSAGEVNVFYMQGQNDLIDWDALAAVENQSDFLQIFVQGATAEWATIIDIRRTIDWAESRPEIDSKRVGLVGFSHGAMVAAVVAAHEPRLKATAVVMGGAHSEEVLAQCPLSRSVEAKALAAREFGWDEDDLQRYLEPIFLPIDIASHPGRVDPSTVLIVEAAGDECMTPRSRATLFQAMGKPERVLLKGGHKQAFLGMTPLRLYSLRKRLWQFFEEKLEPGNPS